MTMITTGRGDRIILILSLVLVAFILDSRRSGIVCEPGVAGVGRNADHDHGTGYRNDNRNLTGAPPCTADQRSAIFDQLGLSEGKVRVIGCQDADWLDSFFKEEEDIGSPSYLGISVGCNKGLDAVRAARLGTMDPDFDDVAYGEAIRTTEGMDNTVWCPPDAETRPEAERRVEVDPSRTRRGEHHCVEPMASNFFAIEAARASVGLDASKLVATLAAISGEGGTTARFPNGRAGTENLGLHTGCAGISCEEAPVFTLDEYAERFVLGEGPVNYLSVDTEGHDFNVLVGGWRTLGRTHFLEFEYHAVGPWRDLHVQDAVRLLDRKGFTCYWSSEMNLWRITNCYFDVYDQWHGWSNVACVHRSQTKLLGRMEGRFLSTLQAKA